MSRPNYENPRELFPGPALLFAPANRPERFPKAVAAADMVILDLEDGAGEWERVAARRNIIDSHLDPARTIVRTSGPDDPGFFDDLAALRDTEYHYVMVPKLERNIPPELNDYLVIAQIETPSAVVHLPEIAAHDSVVALLWGSEDLTVALGGTHSRLGVDEGAPVDRPGSYRSTVALVRSLMHISAAAVGKCAIDAVHADFHDDRGQWEEATDAARVGFVATACIHPRQCRIVREAYTPEPHKIDWARRVLERYSQEEKTTHHGAFQVDGEMVDRPLITQAQEIMRRAALAD